MNSKRFERSNLYKMTDRIDEIKRLYMELSEETRKMFDNKFNNNFNNDFDGFELENKPLAIVNYFEIVLRDCSEIVTED